MVHHGRLLVLVGVLLVGASGARAQDEPARKMDEVHGRRQLIERRLRELAERIEAATRSGDHEDAARLAREREALEQKLERSAQEVAPLERRVELRTLLSQIHARRADALARGRERVAEGLARELEQVRAQLAELGDRGPFEKPRARDDDRAAAVEAAEVALRSEATQLPERIRRAQQGGRLDEAEALTRRLDEVHGQLELLAAARQKDEPRTPGDERAQRERRAERIRRALDDTRRELAQAREARDRDAIHAAEEKLADLERKLTSTLAGGERAERPARERDERPARERDERPAREGDDQRHALERLAQLERDLQRRVQEQGRRIHAEAQEKMRAIETEARAQLEQARAEVRRRFGDPQQAERGERGERGERAERGGDEEWRARMEGALRGQAERAERLERELRELRAMLEEALRRGR